MQFIKFHQRFGWQKYELSLQPIFSSIWYVNWSILKNFEMRKLPRFWMTVGLENSSNHKTKVLLWFFGLFLQWSIIVCRNVCFLLLIASTLSLISALFWTSIWKEQKEKVSFPHYYCSKTSHESIFFHAKVTVTHIISQGGSSSGTSSMNDTHKSFNITFLRFWRVHTTTARGLIHPPFFYSGRILQCSISRFQVLEP